MITATDRLTKQAKKVTKDLRELTGSAKDAAQEKLRQLRANASERCEQGRDKVRQAERAVERFIQSRPLKTVLIAAGIGAFLGGLWCRRIATARTRKKCCLKLLVEREPP